MQRHREKQMVDLKSGAPWETVKLTTVGRDPEFFSGFLDSAREAADKQQEGYAIVGVL